MNEELKSVQEVAEIFGVTTRTVTNWIKDGVFPNAFKAYTGLRAPYLIPVSDIEAEKEKRNPAPSDQR